MYPSSKEARTKALLDRILHRDGQGGPFRRLRITDAWHDGLQTVEYRAALGRHLEDALDARRITSPLADEAFIEKVRVARSTAPDVDELLTGLEADRASGVLAAQFDDDPLVYDSPGTARLVIRSCSSRRRIGRGMCAPTSEAAPATSPRASRGSSGSVMELVAPRPT